MSETTQPDPGDEQGQQGQPGPAPSGVNVTALVAEAMSKSGLFWVDVPGDRPWPVWHAWDGSTAYVVNGPGEQHLPWLPEQVPLILRSQDTGGRLLTVLATTQVLDPASPEWDAATALLKAGRLNAVDDVLERWRTRCTVTALRPFGEPLPTSEDAGRAAPAPTRATTGGLRPKHLGGRPQRRRGTR